MTLLRAVTCLSWWAFPLGKNIYLIISHPHLRFICTNGTGGQQPRGHTVLLSLQWPAEAVTVETLWGLGTCGRRLSWSCCRRHRGSLSLGLGLGHSETLGHSGTSLDRVMELALTPLGIPGFTSLV